MSLHAIPLPCRPTCGTWSSAPASPACAPRSSSTRTASTTSSSSRRGRTSAAPGATTPTRARPATCRASSTRSPSRPTPTGRCRSRRSPRSRPTCAGVARESGVLDRFVFDTVVESASWDDATQLWTTVTSAGTVTSQTLVVGAGGLSEPRLPDIDGIEEFAGEVFHSARWNHDVDLAGKRVAVIGTGASAIQIVPELQKVAATSTSTSAPRRTSCPATTGRTRGSSGRSSATSGPRRRPTARRSTGAARPTSPASRCGRGCSAPARRDGAGQHRQGRLRPRAAGQGSPRRSRSGASGS